MKKKLRVLALISGLATNILMLGVLLFLIIMPSHALEINYGYFNGLEFWIEVPLLFFTSIIMAEWLYDVYP